MRTCTENFKIKKWIKCQDNFWKVGKFKKGERAWESNKCGAKMRTFMESSDNLWDYFTQLPQRGPHK